MANVYIQILGMPYDYMHLRVKAYVTVPLPVTRLCSFKCTF